MKRLALASLAGIAAFVTLPAWAAFPDKPLTLIVPYPPGGATDVVGRILAKSMGARLGQNIVVENKAGGGTSIGAAAVANAAPDGYTLFFSSNTTYTINAAIKPTLPYDPAKLSAIGVIGAVPLALVANPSFPAANAKELVALAKKDPGKYSLASFGAGTSSHFAGEVFKLEHGLEMVHVPYKGSAPAMQDLIAGQVPLLVDTALAAIPHARAGKLKVLAVLAAKRVPQLPDVPTIGELGCNACVLEPWGAVVTSPGVPLPVRQVLTKALAETLTDADVRAQLEKAGFNVAWEPPEAYDARVAKELPALRAIVQKAKITAD